MTMSDYMIHLAKQPTSVAFDNITIRVAKHIS